MWFALRGRRNMKRSMSPICGGLAGLVFALAACSGGDQANVPAPGVATVGFRPKPVMLPYINLSRARTMLDRLQLVGNVPQYPPQQQLPDGPPPPPPGQRIDLDALSAGTSAAFEDLPQGIYSRVRFIIGRIWLEGTWKGTRFQVSLAPFGAIVDIRAPTPQELGLDRDIAFQVVVDPNIWFPPYLFDGAMLDDRGEIICDEVSNTQIAATLTRGMAGSFSLP
jgi:hypothetical protein